MSTSSGIHDKERDGAPYASPLKKRKLRTLEDDVREDGSSLSTESGAGRLHIIEGLRKQGTNLPAM